VFAQNDNSNYQQLIRVLRQKDRALYEELIGPGASQRREELRQEKLRVKNEKENKPQ
jgi:hypothetical protein